MSTRQQRFLAYLDTLDPNEIVGQAGAGYRSPLANHLREEWKGDVFIQWNRILFTPNMFSTPEGNRELASDESIRLLPRWMERFEKKLWLRFGRLSDVTAAQAKQVLEEIGNDESETTTATGKQVARHTRSPGKSRRSF